MLSRLSSSVSVSQSSWIKFFNPIRRLKSLQKEDGAVLKAGGKCYFESEYLGKSEAEVQAYLLDHAELYGKIYREVSQ